MKINKLLLFFLIIFSAISKEIILTKENDKYFFKANIANLNINLHPVLSLQRQNTWIKAEDCKYCLLVTPQQKDAKGIEKIYDKMYDCSKSCFDKSQEAYGLKCLESQDKCKIIKNYTQISIDLNKKAIGKLIEVKIEVKPNDQKIDDFQTVLVQKIIENQSSETEIAQEGSIGKYMIWASDSIFQTNIIAKNSKQQLVIYDGLKSNGLEKLLLPETLPIEIEFEETITELTLSQIKLNEKITINHPQKIIQDHEIPILPLSKGFISLETQNLRLPKKNFQKLIQNLIPTYFSSQNNKCEFKDGKISCEKSLSLAKVQFLQLQLILNGISIGFPLKVLLKNCKTKTCDLRISLSKNDSHFTLGTFFLEIFAIEYVTQTENIKLHRLDNQWNQFYSKDQKYHKENFNIIWWIGSSFFYAVFYVLKIIFYLAILSLAINFVYHWRKVIEWGGKICEKIKKKAGSHDSSELFEQDQDLEAKDTAKLIKRFKNRKKVFVQDQDEALNDEITTEESSN